MLVDFLYFSEKRCIGGGQIFDVLAVKGVDVGIQLGLLHRDLYIFKLLQIGRYGLVIPLFVHTVLPKSLVLITDFVSEDRDSMTLTFLPLSFDLAPICIGENAKAMYLVVLIASSVLLGVVVPTGASEAMHHVLVPGTLVP